MEHHSQEIPVVSVIMPAYCAEKYIVQAIESVLIQDVPLELIVIDDASSDGTWELLKQYRKLDHVRCIHSRCNHGAAAARNYGTSVARGTYIAYLDADDWWAEGKLRRQLELMKRTGAALCSTGRELVRADGTLTGKVIPVKNIITYRDLLKQNSINCSSVLIRREAALEFPMMHDEDSHEDYLTWLRVVKKYGFCAALDKPYLKCRLSGGGKSRNKVKSALMTYRVYRYMNYGILKSCCFFLSYAVHGVLKYL